MLLLIRGAVEHFDDAPYQREAYRRLYNARRCHNLPVLTLQPSVEA